MHRWMLIGPWLLLSFSSGSARIQEQTSTNPSLSAAYPDSADGLQQQFQDFLQIIRSSDQVAVQRFLDSFAIPNADVWFIQHFDPSRAPELAEKYKAAFEGIRSHIWWATGTFAQYPDFAYRVQASESPKPISPTGFESLLPHPLDDVLIENYRLSSASTDSTHGPPSWVSSFVHIDGRFRWLGGTYPFWAEGLTALRGPMSLPPVTLHGRVIQAIAFRNDSKGQGVDGIVQLKIKVERDGQISKVKFLSGDADLLEDAKEYLRNSRFPALPNDPRLANAERIWKLEVGFFAAPK